MCRHLFVMSHIERVNDDRVAFHKDEACRARITWGDGRSPSRTTRRLTRGILPRRSPETCAHPGHAFGPRGHACGRHSLPQQPAFKVGTHLTCRAATGNNGLTIRQPDQTEFGTDARPLRSREEGCSGPQVGTNRANVSAPFPSRHVPTRQI